MNSFYILVAVLVVASCYACKKGYYGDECNEVCGFCKKDKCDSVTGACLYGCEPGYVGWDCWDDCPDGTFGKNCSQNCAEKCKSCDNEDGWCWECEVGYEGDFCDKKCSKGTFGLDCYGDCYNCPHGKCDHITGDCTEGECPAGLTGPGCQYECDSGTYGVGCSETCNENCRYGDCYNEDGTCWYGCKDGYQGDYCEEECPADGCDYWY